MICLWEYIFVITFFSLYMMEKLIRSCFFLMMPCFHYIERFILRTIDIGAHNIQDLFTYFLFIMKILVFCVS
jgi:hypothetical protein